MKLRNRDQPCMANYTLVPARDIGKVYANSLETSTEIRE